LGDGKYGLNPYGKCDLKRIMLKIFKTAAPNIINMNRQGGLLQVCWKASGKVGEPKDVKIMELSELKELQKSHEPGTPEDNASILAWRRGSSNK
jgi:hypothetical protein